MAHPGVTHLIINRDDKTFSFYQGVGIHKRKFNDMSIHEADGRAVIYLDDSVMYVQADIIEVVSKAAASEGDGNGQ